MIASAREIVATLFRHAPGLVELRAFDVGTDARPPRRAFARATDGDALDTFAAEHVAAGRNVFFGCATRRDTTSGKAENCLGLPVLYADLDFKGEEAREGEAMSRLIESPIPPTLVTHSGGGLHAFWRLAAPLALDTPQAQAEAVTWLRRLAQALDADAQCAEVARVLRLPGTVNHKYDPPRPVAILSWAPDAVADLPALDAWLPALVEPPSPVWTGAAGSAPLVGSPSSADLAARVRAYLAATPPAIQGHNGDAHTFRVCCAIVRDFAVSPGEALSLLADWNARCVPPWTERELAEKIAHAERYGRAPLGVKRDTPAPTRASLAPRSITAEPLTACAALLDAPAIGDEAALATTTGEPFAHTDLGNAEFFARHYGDRVRFDHRRKRWLVWDPPTWRPDADAAVHRLAHAAVRRRYTEAGRLDDADAKKKAAGWAIKSEARDRLAALLTLAQTLEPIADTGTAWDADPWLLACPNGVIDLRTGTLRAGRHDDKLTLRAGVAFDPGATAPRFERFLGEIFDGDGERVSWLTRAVGYSLTGATGEQIFFLLYGRGANGKGTLARVLDHVLGDFAFNLPFSTFEARPGAIPNDLAALAGRRFVTASETNDGTRLNEARIKTLTGEDTITARFLHGEFFSFRPVGKLWLSVNHKPVVRDQSHGFWRRVRLIPFECTFPIDKGLDAALEAEAAGVLAWAVRGCLRWQVEGLGDVPAAVRRAGTEYQVDSDPLAEFLADHTSRIDGGTVPAAALFARYKLWADRTDVPRPARLSGTAFGRALVERGFDKTHTRDGRVYHGLALKTVTSEAA
jgi:putative DNA primase/helicase